MVDLSFSPRLAPYGYKGPDPRFTRQGLLVAFIVGALLGCGITLLWTSRSGDAERATEQNLLAAAQKALADCATASDSARQVYLAERLKLTADLAKALNACPVKAIPNAPVPSEGVRPTPSLQAPQAPLPQPRVAVDMMQKSIEGVLVDGPPHPKRKPKTSSSTEMLPKDGALSVPVPPTASLSAPVAPAVTSGVVVLQVGQERSLKQGGILRLVAISKLNTGQFCVIADDDGGAVRLPSGRSKSIRLSGHTYKLTASVKDKMSCTVRVE